MTIQTECKCLVLKWGTNGERADMLSKIYYVRKCQMKTHEIPYLSPHLSRKVNQKQFCIPRVIKEVSKNYQIFWIFL